MADGITDEMRREALTIAREIWERMRLANVSGIDAEYEQHAVNLVVGKVLDMVATRLTGRAVVDLPEPAGEDADGPYWMGSRAAIQADVERGVPIVRTEWEDFEADAAEADALARLAAVREARRLAAGQSSEATGGVL